MISVSIPHTTWCLDTKQLCMYLEFNMGSYQLHQYLLLLNERIWRSKFYTFTGPLPDIASSYIATPQHFTMYVQ